MGTSLEWINAPGSGSLVGGHHEESLTFCTYLVSDLHAKYEVVHVIRARIRVGAFESWIIGLELTAWMLD